MAFNLIKGIGLAATVTGIGANLVSSWVEDQKMKEEIKKGIDEALAERENNETKEEEP